MYLHTCFPVPGCFWSTQQASTPVLPSQATHPDGSVPRSFPLSSSNSWSCRHTCWHTWYGWYHSLSWHPTISPAWHHAPQCVVCSPTPCAGECPMRRDSVGCFQGIPQSLRNHLPSPLPAIPVPHIWADRVHYRHCNWPVGCPCRHKHGTPRNRLCGVATSSCRYPRRTYLQRREELQPCARHGTDRRAQHNICCEKRRVSPVHG